MKKNESSFERNYWEEIYESGLRIDGTFNAKEHSQYLKAIFQLVTFNVTSIGDFGFGKAMLLKECAAVFKPQRIIALDISKEAVDALLQEDWIAKYNAAIILGDILSYKKEYLKENPLDLLICNSVLQYVREPETAIRELSEICRYMYFSVPTDNDYKVMKKELGFVDPYAVSRSRESYLKMIQPYFTFVSYNLLESKARKKSSYFAAELYQF